MSKEGYIYFAFIGIAVLIGITFGVLKLLALIKYVFG